MNLFAPLKVLWIFFVAAGSRKVHFQNAGNEDWLYSNGPGGECELNVGKAGRIGNALVICSSRWTKNQTVRSDRRILNSKRGCQYYRKSSIYYCYGTDRGIDGPATCTRTVYRYMIAALCGGTWLDWTQCDKTCGGGTTTRIKFTRTRNAIANQTTPKYEKTSERRPCNTQACPKWGPWERGRTVNGSIVECNKTTCTRVLRRSCIYNNNTTASPMLCSGNVTFNDSLEYENLTRQELPCQESECADSTSTQARTDAAATSVTESMDFREYGNTDANTMTTYDSAVIAISPNAMNFSAVPLPKSNIWQGFLIGFICAVALCLVIAFLVYKRVLQKKIKGNSERSRVFTTPRNKVGRYAWSSHSQKQAASGTVESGSYLQPDPSQRPSVPPPSQARETFSRAMPGVYCTVPQNEAASAAGRITTARAGISLKYDDESDPLYSDIPAFTRLEAARDEYSSSEFDRSSGESDDERVSIQPMSSCTEKEPSPVSPSFESKDDGCKSFDSDESRDIVRTLKKPSKKQKVTTSPTAERDRGDVFFSEEEILKDELDSERKSAHSVRYSKILAKKSRPTGESFSGKSDHPVEAGFQWIGGRCWTNSTNSDCSIHSQTTLSMNPVADNYAIHRRPTMLHRRSSRTGSATSFNLDTATSGYNSAAFGDSTDDEYWALSSKIRLSSRHSLRDRGLSRRNTHDHNSRRSLKINPPFDTARQPQMWDLRPRESTSLVDPRLLRYDDDGHAPDIEPFRTARPRYQRSRSLLSRSGRVIPVEDVYSFPIDAAAAKDTPCSIYDLPYDARNKKPVVS